MTAWYVRYSWACILNWLQNRFHANLKTLLIKGEPRTISSFAWGFLYVPFVVVFSISFNLSWLKVHFSSIWKGRGVYINFVTRNERICNRLDLMPDRELFHSSRELKNESQKCAKKIPTNLQRTALYDNFLSASQQQINRFNGKQTNWTNLFQFEEQLLNSEI